MEDGIVTSVDRVPTVHICANRIAFTGITSKDVCFVSAGVCSQYGILVDVVGIGATPARVIRREAKRIEILSNRDDRMEVIVFGVSRVGKASFDDLPSDRYRMFGL